MSQKAIKRRRFLERIRAIRKLDDYVRWCKSNVTVRDDNNVEHPVTTEEALEFIIMTAKPKTK